MRPISTNASIATLVVLIFAFAGHSGVEESTQGVVSQELELLPAFREEKRKKSHRLGLRKLFGPSNNRHPSDLKSRHFASLKTERDLMNGIGAYLLT